MFWSFVNLKIYVNRPQCTYKKIIDAKLAVYDSVWEQKTIGVVRVYGRVTV